MFEIGLRPGLATRSLAGESIAAVSSILNWEEHPPERRNYEFRGAARTILEQQHDEVIISGPADTGKTIACLTLVDQLAWEYSGARIAMVRKRRTDMDSSVIESFRQKILIGGDGVRIFGGEKPQWFDYPNGSRVWVAGMDKESKVLSSEFDAIYVNQAEELGLPDWETLSTRASGRAGNMPYGMLMGDCNPAAPSHWIKSRERSGNLILLQSFHRDNPELYTADGKITEEGKRRIGRLEKLTGSRKLRLYSGLWAAPEGAIYDVFDEERHKVKAFDLPGSWPRFVGVDPLGAYTAAVWVALDVQNAKLVIYREYYEPFGITTKGHAQKILKLSESENIYGWVGGAKSENQARLDWESGGVPLIEPPISDVWAGIDRIADLLRNFNLVITDNCVQLLSELGSYQRVMDNGIPTDKIQDKEQYHLLDALRYIVAWLTTPSAQGLAYMPTKIGRDY